MWKRLLTYVSWLQMAGLLAVAGCKTPGAAVLKSDYVDYSERYAAANNEQLLMNLARMANGDPVNFIQLGSFSSQYQFTGSLGFNANNVANAPGYYNSSHTLTTGSTPPTGGNTVTKAVSEFTESALTLGGSASVGVTASPIFQYLPITGTNLSGLVMNPITDKVFLTLYDQGYSADSLARIMATAAIFPLNTNVVIKSNPAIRMPVLPPSVGITTNYYIDTAHNVASNIAYVLITNTTPLTTTNYTTNYVTFVNNPNDPTYPEFLQLCSSLRDAQRISALIVAPKNGDASPVYSGYSSDKTKLTDVVAAIQASLTVKCNTNLGWVVVSQSKQDSGFATNDPNSQLNDNATSTNGGIQALSFIENGLSETYLLENYSKSQSDPDFSPPQKTPSSAVFRTNDVSQARRVAQEISLHDALKMRTVESAMFNTANEERKYRQRAKASGYPPLYELRNLTNILQIQNDLKLTVHEIYDREKIKPILSDIDAAALTLRDFLRKQGLTNKTMNSFLINQGSFAINIDAGLKARLTTDLTTLFAIGSKNQEAAKFLLGFTKNIAFSTDREGPYALVPRTNNFPLLVRPLMRLTCPTNEVSFDNVLAKVSYGDTWPKQEYFVGDIGDATRNRSVFTLLSYLFAQASISTQNLPVQQLIQVQ